REVVIGLVVEREQGGLGLRVVLGAGDAEKYGDTAGVRVGDRGDCVGGRERRGEDVEPVVHVGLASAHGREQRELVIVVQDGVGRYAGEVDGGGGAGEGFCQFGPFRCDCYDRVGDGGAVRQVERELGDAGEVA